MHNIICERPPMIFSKFFKKLVLAEFFKSELWGRSQITLCIFHGFLTTHPPMVMFYITAKVKIQANGYILLTTHLPQQHNVIYEQPLGTVQILRKQRGWVGGVGQMLTFAYKVGGWVVANAYISKNKKYLFSKKKYRNTQQFWSFLSTLYVHRIFSFNKTDYLTK